MSVAATLRESVSYNQKLLGFSGMMIGVILVFLDTQTVNTSITFIAASVGATTEQISRVQTSYLIGEAMGIFLCIVLHRRYSVNVIYLGAILSFGAFSYLCGQSATLSELVFFRLCQGFAGGVLLPAVTFTRYFAFEKKQQVSIIITSGVIILTSRSLGLSLGGVITSTIGWPWLFHINIPLVILSFALVNQHMKFLGGVKESDRPFSFLMIAEIIALLMTLEVFTEFYNKHGGFAAIETWTLLAILAGLFGSIAMRGREFNNLVNCRIFLDRQFRSGCVLLFGFYVIQFSAYLLLVIFLTQIRGYGPFDASKIFNILSLSQILFVPILFWLLQRVKTILLILIGQVFVTASIGMTMFISINWDVAQIVYPQVLLGVGSVIVIGSLSIYAFETIADDVLIDSSVMFEITISIAGTIGLFATNALLVHGIQYYYALDRERFPAVELDADFDRGATAVVQRLFSITQLEAIAGAYAVLCIVSLLMLAYLIKLALSQRPLSPLKAD